MQQNSEWNSYKAPMVSEHWMSVRLLYSGWRWKQEESKGGGKRSLTVLSRRQTWGKHVRWKRKGEETTTSALSCSFLGNYHWLQIPEQPAVQLFTACLHASLLLWSWLPFLSYFCRRNLISRHTSPTTAIGVDYKTFIATCLGTAQKRGPEIVHK